MLKKINILLEMIQFKHSVFALPFALMGAFLAAGGVPQLTVFFWLVLAMIGARTAAMTFNRIVDRRFDAANPRTSQRALPAGLVSLQASWFLLLSASALFFFACWMLKSLALHIAPFALALTFCYSLSKRFTWLCHLILGLALALAPLGGWIAVLGEVAGYPWALSLGVLLWVAGFDIIYAVQDTDFDRQAGLQSIPARLGEHHAFRLALALHLAAFACFALTGWLHSLHLVYYLGLGLAGAALLYQHILVQPNNLAQIQLAFFTMNAAIALLLFFSTWLSLMISG